jgi:glycosyltransferase involved in cell wall biosynthesis
MVQVLHAGLRGSGEVGDAVGLLSALPDYEHERFDFATSPRGVHALLARLRRREFVARMRAADVVHVHGPAAQLAYPMLLREKPTIWTAHGLEAWWPKLPRLARSHSARGFGLKVDAIVTASGAEAAALRSAASELAPLTTVVPWGLPRVKRRPQARFELRRALGIGDDQVTVLALAGLGDERLALGAVAEAREAGANLAVLVAGSAGELERVMRRTPHVHTLAYDEADPYAIFAVADIFLLPDLHRGCAFSTLAAMDYGVAIIAAQSRSHDELLGSAALLVPLQRRPFAIALLDLIRDPARRTYLEAAARRRARTSYQAAKSRTGILRAYERALAAH